MTASCDFVSLGEKMRELLVKNKKKDKKEKKRKGKQYWSHDWTRKAQNFRAVSKCFLAKLNESGQGWLKV